MNACECQRDAALDELLVERNARLAAEEAGREAEQVSADMRHANAALRRELAEAIGGWNDTQHQLSMSKSDAARLQQEEMALDRQVLTLSAQKEASEKYLELEYGRLRDTLHGIETAIKNAGPHEEVPLKHHAVRLALENLALRRVVRQSGPSGEDKENVALSPQKRAFPLHQGVITTQRGQIEPSGIARKSMGAILVWRLFYDRRRERCLMRCLHAFWAHFLWDRERRQAIANRREVILQLEALHNESKTHLRIKAYRSLARVLRGMVRRRMVSLLRRWGSSWRDWIRIIKEQSRIESSLEIGFEEQNIKHNLELRQARVAAAVLLRSLAVTMDASHMLHRLGILSRLSLWRWYAQMVAYRVSFIHALGLRGGTLVLGFAIRAWEKAHTELLRQKVLAGWESNAKADSVCATIHKVEEALEKMSAERDAERSLGRVRLLLSRLSQMRARAVQQVLWRLVRRWSVSAATAFSSNILDAAERRVREVMLPLFGDPWPQPMPCLMSAVLTCRCVQARRSRFHPNMLSEPPFYAPYTSPTQFRSALG